MDISVTLTFILFQESIWRFFSEISSLFELMYIFILSYFSFSLTLEILIHHQRNIHNERLSNQEVFPVLQTGHTGWKNIHYIQGVICIQDSDNIGIEQERVEEIMKVTIGGDTFVK